MPGISGSNSIDFLYRGKFILPVNRGPVNRGPTVVGRLDGLANQVVGRLDGLANQVVGRLDGGGVTGKLVRN